MTDAWPDVAQVLRGLLEPVAGGAGRVGSVRPTNLAESMPFVLAYRYGGADNGTYDSPSVAVDVYAATKAQGVALAEHCRQVLLEAPYSDAQQARWVDDVVTLSAPIEIPYGDSSVRCWASTYRLSMRRTH